MQLPREISCVIAKYKLFLEAPEKLTINMINDIAMLVYMLSPGARNPRDVNNIVNSYLKLLRLYKFDCNSDLLENIKTDLVKYGVYEYPSPGGCSSRLL